MLHAAADILPIMVRRAWFMWEGKVRKRLVRLEYKLPQEVSIRVKSLVHPGEKTSNLLARIGIFNIFFTLP
jgi:hypothetical protein